MRDGEHKPCPITPNHAIRLNYGEGEDDYMMVCPSHDSIQMFPNPAYTHLRYWDFQDGQMKAVWLNEEVMADLADEGIPITIRESITDTEHELYEQFVVRLGAIASSAVVETTAEEVDEHLTDAEIDYFLKEWEN